MRALIYSLAALLLPPQYGYASSERWEDIVAQLTNGMTRAQVERVVPLNMGLRGIFGSGSSYTIIYNLDESTALSLSFDYSGAEHGLDGHRINENSSENRLIAIHGLWHSQATMTDSISYSIYGIVRHTGIKDAPKGTTLLRAIADAGGFTGKGNEYALVIRRASVTEYPIIDLERGLLPDVEIESGDLIVVPETIRSSNKTMEPTGDTRAGDFD